VGAESSVTAELLVSVRRKRTHDLIVTPPCHCGRMNESVFNLSVRIDELRTHSTEWLRARDNELECEQRRLKVEQLAVRRVLDERGAASVDVVASGTTVREAREAVEVSRALADLPAIAAAAHAGDLSWSQLKPLVELATAETDREWAQRGQNVDPIDLARLARQQKVVTADDAAARREARAFRWWWQQDTGMLAVRGELPDVDGALVKSVFEHLVERMRPPKGQPWDSLAHRGADALLAVCSSYADAVPTGRSRPHVVVQHRLDHLPEVDGVPIAVETLDALRGEAMFDDEFVQDGAVVSSVRSGRAVSPKTERFVERRDQHCRVPGCEQTRRLQNHHLVPSSWGGSDEADNLARVCPHHHGLLIPNGPYALIGNPDRVDGLRLVGREAVELVGARAGPGP
jgi:hypothetical protein